MQKQNKINKYKTFNENSNKPERDFYFLQMVLNASV